MPKISDDEPLSRSKLKAACWYTVAKIAEEEEVSSDIATVSEHFVASLTELVFHQALSFAKDLENFANHAGRTTIGVDDVKLAVRRNDALFEHLSTEAVKNGLALSDVKPSNLSRGTAAAKPKPKPRKSAGAVAATKRKADAAASTSASRPAKKSTTDSTKTKTKADAKSKGKGKAKAQVRSDSESEEEQEPLSEDDDDSDRVVDLETLSMDENTGSDNEGARAGKRKGKLRRGKKDI